MGKTSPFFFGSYRKTLIFVFTKHNYMTTTNTLPAVKVSTDPVMSGDVFYGSFDTTIKGKRTTVHVSNHLKDLDQVYKFRVASKCQAGFINISDWECKPSEIISCWKKNTLVNIQVEKRFENGKVLWFNVLTTKSGKWYSIDLGFLSAITVGTMRESFPDMCDMKLWDLVNAKTWADYAFVNN
jgi:hypothetical protein